MGIMFDEVVGTVSPGESSSPSPSPADEVKPTAAPEADPDRLRRELRVVLQREARLHAD